MWSFPALTDQKNGYVVAREYVDEAESGRVADHPQFRRMLEEATKPEAPFHEILVWKCSRFTRKREHAVVRQGDEEPADIPSAPAYFSVSMKRDKALVTVFPISKHTPVEDR